MENEMIVDGINLSEKGIVKRGTFDKRGYPTGWHINGIPLHSDKGILPYGMYVDDNTEYFKIFIGGILSPTLTEESRKAKDS